MAAKSHPAFAKAPASESQKLRETVTLIDSLSQGGLSEITSIANLAMGCIERPDGHRYLEDVSNALAVIQSRAGVILNDINYQAESVGCNYVEPARHSETTETVGA